MVFRCLLEYNESVHVLLTTGGPEAHALLAGSLPRRVLLRRAPLENRASVGRFLQKWRPQVRLYVHVYCLDVGSCAQNGTCEWRALSGVAWVCACVYAEYCARQWQKP